MIANALIKIAIVYFWDGSKSSKTYIRDSSKKSHRADIYGCGMEKGNLCVQEDTVRYCGC